MIAEQHKLLLERYGVSERGDFRVSNPYVDWSAVQQRQDRGSVKVKVLVCFAKDY